MRNFGNPITFGTVPEILLAVLNVLMVIAVPIIVFYLIFAGFKYVAARGNPEAMKDASRSLMYGIIGGVVIIGSFTILEIVKSIVDEF